MVRFSTKMANKQMAEADWTEFKAQVLNKNIELNFKLEDRKNQASFSDIVLIEFDGESLVCCNGFSKEMICSEFNKILNENSFYSPIDCESVLDVITEQVFVENSKNHELIISDEMQDLLATFKKIDIRSLPVICKKIKWGIYSIALMNSPIALKSSSLSIYKASVLCLALSVMNGVQAQDALEFESESGIDRVAKKMNDRIKENYRMNPGLQREMSQDPNFDQSRIVDYKRVGNQVLNDYIKSDTGVYPALKSLEDKIQDYFNGDNALENRQEFKEQGKLPQRITADLTEEDALSVETQLRTQVLRGQARLKITTSLGDVSTEVRAFGGDVFRCSARTKALELKEFGISVQGTVDYRNAEINSAIRTRINPNTSFHMENVRSVASEGKSDNRVRLNYDLDF